MNMNGLFGPIGRMLTQRLMNWGMNKGIDLATRRTGGITADGKPSAAATKQARATRQAVKRARQAARITRRLG